MFMKAIHTIGVFGLGALGTLYADTFTRAVGKERVLVLADQDRIERYNRDGIWFNGERCDFHYVDVAQRTEPVDLLMFAVKYGALNGAVEECRRLVGPDTILISILNGIISEQILAETFGAEKVVWCVAQKMAAKKEGNQVVVEPKGELAVGVPAGLNDGNLHALTAFFDVIHFPYSVPEDIRTKMWSKLLCNTGCNQTAMVFQGGYGLLQKPGKPRNIMVGAMHEVMKVANAEGVPLSEEDVRTWVSIIDGFPPEGEPSMRQDGKAHRKSEVELFAGTIRRLGRKHGIDTPVNDWLYEKVHEMESQY
jgi:2-dehydropantoate 2-reductase